MSFKIVLKKLKGTYMHIQRSFNKLILTFFITIIFGTANIANATVHTVQFGGFTYSPNSFSASVGDTVRWVGDFSFHPLVSTTIPPGAAPWSVFSGSQFNYVIQVQGRYDYVCEFHSGVGMVGTFNVVTTGILDNGNIPDKFSLRQNYPNPFNPSTKITFEIPEISHVNLSVYNTLGNEIITLVDKELNPGTYSFDWSPEKISGGVYFVQLTAGIFVETRKMILLK